MSDCLTSRGYDCAIVDPPKLVQCECSICLLVLREPHLVSCCGHNFCQACIVVVQNSGECCPFCRTAEFTTMHNKGLERTLKSLLVKCENVGCTWNDELATFDHHLEACLYVNAECKHGCSTVIKRKDITEHENQCGRRPFSCAYCEAYTATYDDVVNVHYVQCPRFPVTCPNGCNALLEPQYLREHTDKECPYTLVECDFSCYGCSAKPTRQELPTHLNSNLLLHMSLLLKMNNQLLLEMQQLKADVPQLKVEVSQLKAELNKHKSRADAMTCYLKSSPTLTQDVLITIEVGQLESFVPGQIIQKKNFYSHIGGYKMQLQILCSECSRGIFGTRYRLFPRVYLMKGEFDQFLHWPFEGMVTVSTSLSDDKMKINFSNVRQKCKSRVVNEACIAEEGVDSATVVSLLPHRFGVAIFKIEKVVIETIPDMARVASSRNCTQTGD